MSATVVKRHIAMCLAAFGAAFLAVGVLGGGEAWLVIGMMHLLAASFWLYGKTLS